MSRLFVAVALLSCALIAFQLVLMHVLSLVQWYHFAYMVISVALLGFGASGTLLALARQWFVQRCDTLVPLLMIACSITLTLAVSVSQLSPIRFDSYLVFVEGKELGSLVLTYTVFFLPFCLGALAIGLVFVRYVERIGRMYAANLVGSGVGAVAGLGLLWIVPVHYLSLAVGAMALLAGILVLPQQKRVMFVSAVAIALLVAMSVFVVPPILHPSEYKSLSRTLTFPGASTVHEQSSPFGVVQVVRSPSLRHAPGLSLTFTHIIPSHDVVFNNGEWFGPIVGLKENDSTQLLDFSTMALPYIFGQRRQVLVLQARTGVFVAYALQKGASRVVAIESHRGVLHVLTTDFAAASDSLFLHPSVRVHAVDPRSFLLADTSRYQLIVLPTLDAFGGSSGVYALQEQYLMTKEAFAQMWERLTPDGVLSISSWMDQPVRNPVRTLATIAEMLSDAHIVNPTLHLAAIRSWGLVTFVVKKTPLTKDEAERVHDFCARMQFDPVLLPHVVYERNKHNVLYDPTFFRMVDGVLGNTRETFYENYDFRIRPATDDRPYFSQFLRWRSIPRLREFFGQHTLPFLELGSFIIALTFVQIAVLAALLIVLPLFRKKMNGTNRGGVMLYFAALGLGYMFVEMVLIQRFVLYLGQPLYAAAAVIGAMLIFSGLGSVMSSRLAFHAIPQRRTAIVVAVLIVIYALLINALINQSISLSSPWKFMLTCIMIAPLAFLMGMPFPLGVRALGESRPHAVPWAWGINGCASVVAAPLATLLALEVGLSWVMMSAAGLYLAAAFSAGTLKGKEV